MARPLPGLDVPVVDPQTRQMTQVWYDYFQAPIADDDVAYVEYDIRNYGAVVDGVTDDLVAVQDALVAADDAGGGIILFPPGVTYVTSRIEVPASNISLRGTVPGGVCQIKIPDTYDSGVVAISGSNFSVSDLTLDLNNAAFESPALVLFLSTNFIVQRVTVVGMYSQGIVVQTCADWVIDNCDVTLDNLINTVHVFGIGTFSSLATTERGRISNNRCNGAGIFISGDYQDIINNQVRGIGYGAAINSTDSNYLSIIGNTLSNGRTGALDFNGTPCTGMEIIGECHLVADNLIFDFDGAGIVLFAEDSLVHGNMIWDVAKYAAAPAQNLVGITTANAALGAGYSGSRNIIQHNKVFQTGGLTNIKYGYSEYGASGSGILNNHIVFNRFVGSLGVVNIAAVTTFYTLLGSLGEVNFSGRLKTTTLGSAVAGSGALATTATDGDLYISTCAGVPTGVPTTITGYAPVRIDTTNNRIYFYSSGAWRNAGP